MRTSIVLLLLALLGCGPATTDAAPQATPIEEAPTPAEASAQECRALVRDYLDARDAANSCARDEDCAEIFPGLCPNGPYYVQVDGDRAPIDAAATALSTRCVLPECEMPRPLGIARCDDGTCVEGRTPPMDNGLTSCWDTEITWLQPGRARVGDSYPYLQGITRLFGVGVPGPGLLRVTAELGCDGCALQVSETNPSMGSPLAGRPFTPAPTEPDAVTPSTGRAPPAMGEVVQLEYDVVAAPHYLAALGGERAGMRIEIELLDPKGQPMAVDRRGETHLRICED
jgi:hypothetical protein